MTRHLSKARRKIRMAMSLALTFLAAACLVLWIRSYWVRDRVWWQEPDRFGGVNSANGTMEIFLELKIGRKLPNSRLELWSYSLTTTYYPNRGAFCFYYARTNTGLFFAFPHWTFVLVFGACSFLLFCAGRGSRGKGFPVLVNDKVL